MRAGLGASVRSGPCPDTPLKDLVPVLAAVRPHASDRGIPGFEHSGGAVTGVVRAVSAEDGPEPEPVGPFRHPAGDADDRDDDVELCVLVELPRREGVDGPLDDESGLRVRSPRDPEAARGFPAALATRLKSRPGRVPTSSASVLKFDAVAASQEQQRADIYFKFGNVLLDCGLGQAESRCRRGKAPFADGMGKGHELVEVRVYGGSICRNDGTRRFRQDHVTNSPRLRHKM